MQVQDYGDWIAQSSTHSTTVDQSRFLQLQYLQKLGFDIFHRCGCDANFEPHIQNTVISLSSEFGVTCVCW
jgi:hypothetical protein